MPMSDMTKPRGHVHAVKSTTDEQLRNGHATPAPNDLNASIAEMELCAKNANGHER